MNRATAFADRATRALLPLAAYATAIATVDLADWGLGWIRAGGLAAIAWALFALWRRPVAPARGLAPFVWAALAVALVRLGAEAAPLRQPNTGRYPNDIGWTTERAVAAIDAGQPLYASNIDPQRDIPRGDPGFGFYFGYKYGPLVPRWYAPFLRAFGQPRGLYLANLVLLAACALLSALFAARAAGSGEAGAAAAFCVLFPTFTYFELFSQGVNDLLPTVLVMAALFAAARKQGFAAGLALGLSLAAKPLPGGFYLLLLPGTVALPALALGVAAGLLPYAPHLLSEPRELIANLFLFNVSRPFDSTSVMAFLPGWMSPLVALAGVAAIAGVAIAYHRGPRTPARLALASALLATAFLATGKIVHRNYFLWWTPLLGAALGVACYGRAGAAESETSAG